MTTEDTQFAWWSRLRHSGLLLSPVVQVEKYAEAPEEPKWYQPEKLRTAYNRFLASIDRSKDRPQLAQGDILTWVDALLEKYIGHKDQRLCRSHAIPESLTAVVRIGSRSETLRPDRVLFDADGKTPLLLVKADASPHIGRGKGRTEYARFLELIRGCGHRLGLLTNGLQFRLVYAGLDFESWCEWESERWFEDFEGTEELHGLRQMLFPTQITDNKGEVIGAGLPGLLNAIEESRKRQADLSQVLRENVRQAVELLLEDVSHASRTDAELFTSLVTSTSHQPSTTKHQLSDAEAHEALMQATVRVVMRMVVCLFAESRGLLPVNDLVYSQAYGVRTLYELLDETVRHEGSQLGLMSRQSAWARLMALFRLIHGGSAHGNFPLRPYGGALFRPGKADDNDAVSRALFILEHKVNVNDATIFRVLRKLLRGPLPVLRGRSKTYVEGPVDYTELRTEFIGLIYEGLLDYRVKRTTEEIGPQVFLKLGRQPVLPLSRLESMLENDSNSLKDLFTKLKKESVAATVESDDEDEESDDDSTETEESEEPTDELSVEVEVEEEVTDQTYLDALQAAQRWARQAIIATNLIGQQRVRETDTKYNQRIEDAIDELIDRVVAPGEFYLVRAGNTRKGTGTFYTRPQLAVPTVHRTLEPLCFDKDGKGVLTPKTPDEILALKVCDPACGSASFLVAALHYLTDALYKSLCFHCGLDDPKRAAKITLPFGKPATGQDTDATVPLPPDDPNRGEEFSERVQALLRRHIVERCIYGVDINPLAIEFARVSLWVETLDPELPFSFLDHKIKVGNSLVGCWLDRVDHYPLKAWEREGGDGKGGPQSERIEDHLKGEKIDNRRSGDGRIKQEMRQVINARFDNAPRLFSTSEVTTESVVASARQEYERVHDISVSDPDQRERHYRQNVENSPAFQTLKSAMDEWCAIWFWSADDESLVHVPTPLTFHRPDAEKDAFVAKIAEDLRFFHWELQFPDVFTPTRSGFDAMLGNPPWDVMKPNSQEFFTDFDPLYRSYDKQTALKRQRELLEALPNASHAWNQYNALFKALGNWARNAAKPFDISLARGKQGSSLASTWERHRVSDRPSSTNEHPFRLQGSADLNLYKLFTEVFWHLLQQNGRLGVVLPTGLYSDFGTKTLRETLLFKGRLDFVYAFQNEKKVFEAAFHGYKQAVFCATKGGVTDTVRARFRLGVGDSPHAQEIPDDVLTRDSLATTFTVDEIKANSPNTLSLIEIRTSRDATILNTIYQRSIRIGDKESGWNLQYAREFDMTNDSRLFPVKEKWEAKGYRPDLFGRWLSPDGETAEPLYQGRLIHHFDFWRASYVSGNGPSAVWQPLPFDNKHFGPRNLMDLDTHERQGVVPLNCRVVFRDIARSTDTRSMIACCIPPMPCNNKVPLISNDPDLIRTLLLASVLSSFSFDFVLRNRLCNATINWFILEECPLPQLDIPQQQAAIERIALSGAFLTFLHRRFAPAWLRLLQRIPLLHTREWKMWWAVTEAERLRFRCENDALVAELYGLDPEAFEWIVRDDPKDPKGFYRVERQLPYEERLTGLSARAFRALKEGKWSAETVGQISNDEFFDLLGIPELTNTKTAQAKGLSGPLILKREGCHSWHPEDFPAYDPRHGWTWEDCRKDAITLLGSEEALEAYIAQATSEDADDEDEEPDPNHSGPKDLLGTPIPTDLFGNEIRTKKKRR